MKAMLVLLGLVLLMGCVESNPQPSPGGPDAAGDGAQDVVADARGKEGDAGYRADSVDMSPRSEVVDTIDAETTCVPNCDGKECGDDGCGGECCGGEPLEPGASSCCGGIADGTCSEYCPGWLSAPPKCIPPVECIQDCIAECPPGWDCINYAFYGTDVSFYCFPEPLGPPCQPCEADEDCPGGILWEVDRCSAVLGEVPTCVSPCSAIPKLPCPPWHSCVSAETVEGEVHDVCVPDPGLCECVPVVEICDGLDNDCDGVVDDGFDDLDGDGVPDCCDPDGDGVPTDEDNCPSTFNPDQANEDMDGLGDACDLDDDGDDFDDWVDCAPLTEYIHPGALEVCDGADNNCDGLVDENYVDADFNCWADCVDFDIDTDTVPDILDNCPSDWNLNQANNDSDGQGDVCDGDDDNDGLEDAADNCPLVPNLGQEDTNQDGIGDVCDDDADGDGTPDGDDCLPMDGSSYPGAPEKCDWVDNNCDGSNNEGFPNPVGIYNMAILSCTDFDEDADCVVDKKDNCPGISNEAQWDRDSDGLGDACDPDIDGDGHINEDDCIPTDDWVFPGAPEVCDGKDNDCNGGTDEDMEATDCLDCDPCTVDLCVPEEGGCTHVDVECPDGGICDQATGQCTPE